MFEDCSQLLLIVSDGLVPLAGLILVLDDVLLLQLPHPLYFVQIYNEALIITVERLDAFTAENVQVIRAIEVLDTLRMYLAQFVCQAFFIFILELFRN